MVDVELDLEISVMQVMMNQIVLMFVRKIHFVEKHIY